MCYVTKLPCVLVIVPEIPHEGGFIHFFQEKVYSSLKYRAKLKKARGSDPLNKLTSTAH